MLLATALIVLLLALIGWKHPIVRELNLNRTTPPPGILESWTWRASDGSTTNATHAAPKCEVLREGLHGHGFEEVLVVAPSVALTCASELHSLQVLKDSRLVPNGTCFSVELHQSKPIIRPVTIVGFPADVAFHPHGGFVRKTLIGIVQIFYINHAYSQGSERIDVFTLEGLPGSKGAKTVLPGETTLVMRYTHSVRSAAFDSAYYGGLNDVAIQPDAVGADVYVTNWKVVREMTHGPTSLTLGIENVARIASALTRVGFTHVLRCRDAANGKLSKPAVCEVVDSSLGMANGITIARHEDYGTFLFVSDLIRSRVMIYHQPRGNIEDMKRIAIVPVYRAIDNIHFAFFSDEAGPNWFKAVFHVGCLNRLTEGPHAPATSTVAEISITLHRRVSPEGLMESWNASEVVHRDLAIDYGALGTLASGAVLYSADEDTKGDAPVTAVVGGSWAEPGLLWCIDAKPALH